jgi:hypothetical protein
MRRNDESQSSGYGRINHKCLGVGGLLIWGRFVDLEFSGGYVCWRERGAQR